MKKPHPLNLNKKRSRKPLSRNAGTHTPLPAKTRHPWTPASAGVTNLRGGITTSFLHQPMSFPQGSSPPQSSSFPRRRESTSQNKETLTFKELEDFPHPPMAPHLMIKKVLEEGRDLRLVDLHKVRQNHQNIKKAFPFATVYVALKAVSTRGMPEVLAGEGACFEVATLEEALSLQKLSVKPQQILFTHTDKDAHELQAPFVKKIKAFASDSEGDLKLLSHQVPGARVLIRLNAQNKDPTVGDRFGVSYQEAKRLILFAHGLGLQPVGLTFHVGTQALSPGLWRKPIQTAGRLFHQMRKKNITLHTLDLGGGLPAPLDSSIRPLSYFSQKIHEDLKKSFQGKLPQNIIIEPGRSLSASAGLTLGRVISVKHLKRKTHTDHIVTLSTGRFNAGLIGIGQKTIFYSCRPGGPMKKLKNTVPGFVYGKVAAVLDKIHTRPTTLIPPNLKPKDLVVSLGTGAYVDRLSSEWCGKKIPTDLIYDSQKAQAPARPTTDWSLVHKKAS